MSVAIPDTYVRCKSNDNNNIINVCLNNTMFIYHNLITIYTYYCNKTSITTVAFNGLSSAAYGNGILYSERTIFS